MIPMSAARGHSTRQRRRRAAASVSPRPLLRWRSLPRRRRRRRVVLRRDLWAGHPSPPRAQVS